MNHNAIENGFNAAKKIEIPDSWANPSESIKNNLYTLYTDHDLQLAWAAYKKSKYTLKTHSNEKTKQRYL